MIGAIIGAVVAIASAAMQADAQRTAAKQSNYDAEFEAEQAKMQAEQERMDREYAQKISGRESEQKRQERIAMLTRAGGGIGVSALQELSMQASYDEMDDQNAGIRSRQRRRQLDLLGRNALLAGKTRAANLRTQATNTMWTGVGSAVGSVASGYQSNKQHNERLKAYRSGSS